MRFNLFVLLCALTSMLAVAPLAAEEISWNSPVTGAFGTAANWQPTMVPGVNDVAIFDLGSTGYTVNFNSVGVRQLRVGNDKLTLFGFQLTAGDQIDPAIQFGTGAGDVAEVELQFGTLTGKQIWLGAHEQASVKVSLNGNLNAGSSFPTVPGELVVGAAGDAELQIKSGRAETNGKIIVGRDSTAQGAISMSGGRLTALGTELIVGQSGKGELTATSSSRIDINGELMVGRDAGSQGDISVSGSNARIGTPGYGNYRMTATTIGAAGKGSFSIGNDATARLEGPIVLGRDATGDGTLSVDGEGTYLDAYKRIPPSPVGSPGIAVGMSGKGKLSITGGAGASLSGPIIVGQDAGASGEVTIDGANTVVSRYGAGGAGALSLTVGKAGKGDVTISGGASAELEGPVIVGEQATGDGKLNVKGLHTRLSFSRSNSETIDQLIVGASGKGAMTVSDSAVANFRDAKLRIAPNAGATGAVTITESQTQLIVDQVDVGGAGVGSLSVLNQGELSVWKSTTGKGIINVHAGSTFNVSAGHVTAPPDRKLSVDNAGALSLTSSQIIADVNNSGTFDNNGTVLGNVVNTAGGVISGGGTITGNLTQTGGIISPGNSPGMLDVGSLALQSGVLVVEMNSALGTAGGPVGWDLIASHGMVSVTGPLTVELISLSLNNQPGDVFDFNPDRSKSWTIIRGGTGGSSIFDPNLLTLDTSGFTNEFAGRFSLSVLGANIALTYVRPVPEPATMILLGLGVLALVAAYCRRARG